MCSDKCFNSLLPFNSIDDIGFISTHLGDGKKLCRKCKRDCVIIHTKCVECYHCEASLHKECLETIDKHNAYFCSDKCMTKVMPFTNSSFEELVTYEILSPSNTPPKLDISEIENDDTSETRNNTQFTYVSLAGVRLAGVQTLH